MLCVVQDVLSYVMYMYTCELWLERSIDYWNDYYYNKIKYLCSKNLVYFVLCLIWQTEKNNILNTISDVVLTCM